MEEPDPQEVAQVKQLRADIQVVHDKARAMPGSRAMSLTITKLDEASMWLGKRLQEMNTPNPYPNSKNPAVPGIEPTAPEATRL